MVAAVLFVFLGSGFPYAMPEERTDKNKSDNTKECHIWLSSDNTEEPFRKLQILPLSALEDHLLMPEAEIDLNGREKSRTARVLTAAAPDSKPGSPELGTNSFYTLTGYERSTHLLLNPNAGPSPGILLIKKSINEQETYFGLLSFIFKW
jgi:hypothetical protein